MVDTDISHAVEERLAAIEERLDTLEGNNPADEGLPDDETEVVEETDTEEEGLI